MKSINGNIDKIKSELKILNGNIIELEGKRHPDYIKVIENKLNVKNEEIQLLEKSLKDLDKEYNKDKESENQKE